MLCFGITFPFLKYLRNSTVVTIFSPDFLAISGLAAATAAKILAYYLSITFSHLLISLEVGFLTILGGEFSNIFLNTTHILTPLTLELRHPTFDTIIVEI